jgi:hypothetical protein
MKPPSIRETLPANPSASRSPVDELFLRLAVRYGRQWLDMWSDIPMPEIKREWASSLAQFAGYQVEAAIKALGKFPPTLPEFEALCASFRVKGPPTLRLTDERCEPMPDKVRAQLAQFMGSKCTLRRP